LQISKIKIDKTLRERTEKRKQMPLLGLLKLRQKEERSNDSYERKEEHELLLANKAQLFRISGCFDCQFVLYPARAQIITTNEKATKVKVIQAAMVSYALLRFYFRHPNGIEPIAKTRESHFVNLTRVAFGILGIISKESYWRHAILQTIP
jgi:hypothetical protein